MTDARAIGANMADREPNFLGLFNREPHVLTLKSGETLFHKGDPARSMYVVLTGELRIGDGNAIYDRLTEGGIVGEMALIDHGPRSATVTASTDCTLAEVDEKRFLFLVQQTPMFSLQVMSSLAERLRAETR